MNKVLTERQIQAIRIIDCGARTRLTHLGNALVSSHAASLRASGLIREAPERWVAYELTHAGKCVLARCA